jgi:NAD+ diphosphatase
MSHPIDVFRFCPRCGSGDFHPSGSRSLTCKRCDLQYYINSATAVAALIFNKEGKLLLTRRAVDPDRGKYDLPGGFADPLESAEKALARELQEELGIVIREAHYLTSHANEYFFSGITVFTTDLVFRVEAESLDNLTVNDDICGYEWVDPAALNPDEIPAISIRYFVKVIAVNELSHF